MHAPPLEGRATHTLAARAAPHPVYLTVGACDEASVRFPLSLSLSLSPRWSHQAASCSGAAQACWSLEGGGMLRARPLCRRAACRAAADPFAAAPRRRTRRVAKDEGGGSGSGSRDGAARAADEASKAPPLPREGARVYRPPDAVRRAPDSAAVEGELLAARCWLLAAGCSLLAARCSLLAARWGAPEQLLAP